MSMGPPVGRTSEPHGSALLRVILGTQLRQFREAAGVTSEQAGYQIRASRTKISRMEHGRAAVKGRDVADLLAFYGVTDQAVQAKMLTIAGHANTPDWWSAYSDILPGWFETYLSLEEAASAIRTFEIQFVHGLFQTEDYARAVTLLGHKTATAGEIDRRVNVRLKRQEVLTSPDPLHVWSVVDEAVLRRQVGSRAVMRAQLNHLAEVAELPHVTVQMMPFGSGAHAAAGGSFTVLHFDGDGLPDVVYLEQLTSALYLDGRDDVEHYTAILDELTARALTPARTATLLAEIIKQT
jgi:transcriptional regulator with XRE-family HTH domain